MNIYKILPEIKDVKSDNIPPLPRKGIDKTEYAFHLTPVHLTDKGFFGVIVTHKIKYYNNGFQHINCQVYYNYDNNGTKPTMRELFVLTSAAAEILNSLIRQQIDKEFMGLDRPIQKDHIETINASIQQAYPLN